MERDDCMASEILDIRMQENLQMISKLRLLDDDLMNLVFDKNIEATELLLNIILQRSDLKVLEVVAQREYKNAMAGGRSITIDIYAKDSDGKIYDVEVQRADRGADFVDGSHIIYVNGSYKNDSDPIGKLMHDFRCTNPGDMFYTLLAKQVKYFKETEGGRKDMCKAVEELVEKRADEMVLEKQKELAERMIEDDELSIEKIAKYTGLPINVIEELAKSK